MTSTTTSLKKSNQPIKIGFTQEYGIVPGTMIVSVGLDFSGIRNLFMKKHNRDNAFDQKAIKWFNSIEEELSTALKSSSGTVFFSNNTNSCILQMKDFNWSLSTTSVLVHELNHVVEDLANNLGFQGEMEFKAYLQGYLFQEIAGKIHEHDKK